MIQQRVDGKDLKDRIKILLSFFTPSKIYYYGNYTQVKVHEDVIEFTQVNIVGEAINTGLLEVSVQGEHYLEEEKVINVPTEELKKIVNQIPEEVNDIVVADNYLAIISYDKEITIPVVDSDVPRNLIENHELIKQVDGSAIDIKLLNKAINEVNHATKGVIVSYDNYAIYLENESVYVNKGVRITRQYLTEPLELTEGLYLPLYMVPVLKQLDDENVKLARTTTVSGEDLVMVRGDNFAIHFQEWYSKREFPIGPIKQMTQLTQPQATPEYLAALGDLSTADKVLELDLTNSQIRTKDGKIEIDVPALNTPKVYISTEVMPKKAEMKKYHSVEVGPSTVVFQGEDNITIVATMEES